MLRDILAGKAEQGQGLVCCEPHATVAQAAMMMAEKNVGSIMVLSSGKPRGILTDRDIVVRCVARNIDVNDCTVENVMTESLETCSENEGIFDCIRKMEAAGVRRIPVVNENGDTVGIISFGDLLSVLSKELAALVKQTTIAEKDDDLLVDFEPKMAA